jgi:hypothetical protein
MNPKWELHIVPWSWPPMKGWHVEPFARSLESQRLIFHRNNPILLIVKNHTFLPFNGTTNTILLANKMTNHTMHNLRQNKI